MKTKKSIKLRKIFIAAAAITTLSAAFTSCKKDSNILPAESIEKSTTTGEFKEDHAAKFFDRDGNEFEQVHIHRYAWMTSNLKTNTANSEITEKGEHYYTYADAMSGVCPEGWFIPTTDAWEDLKEEMGHHCNGGEPEGISKAMRCNGKMVQTHLRSISNHLKDQTLQVSGLQTVPYIFTKTDMRW